MTAGLVISTISVNALTLIIISLLNWIKKEEKMDFLKALDLILLIAGVFTIAFSYTQSHQSPLGFEHFLVLGITIGSYVAFLVWIGRDQSSQLQFFKSFNFPSLQNGEHAQKLALLSQSLMKLFGIHFFGAILLIPFSYGLWVVSGTSDIAQIIGNFLFIDLPQCFICFQNLNILALIILSTILPYFFLVLSAVTWPKNQLKHDMWAGVFTLIDPLIGMNIGFFIWAEQIRPDYIIFTTIFLLTGIFIRYFYGSINMRRFLFIIKLKQNEVENFLRYITKIKEIDLIQALIGTYDFLLHVTVHSMARLAQISQHINYFQGLESATYSVEEKCI
jgi:hypothetical protein